MTIGITQTNASAPLYGRLQQLSTSLSALSILFSSTAFFGNFLIFVTLHKESSLHPPSKLFYRCLATTDLLVGLLIHPLSATHWMSSLREKWRICRYTFSAWYNWLYLMLSILNDDDSYKRGQTSRLAVETDLQTSRDFKAHLYCHSHLLGYIWSRYFK